MSYNYHDLDRDDDDVEASKEEVDAFLSEIFGEPLSLKAVGLTRRDIAYYRSFGSFFEHPRPWPHSERYFDEFTLAHNAAIVAMFEKKRRLRYMQGFLLSDGVIIPYAWCQLPNGSIIDVGLRSRTEQKRRYFGITFSTATLLILVDVTDGKESWFTGFTHWMRTEPVTIPEPRRRAEHGSWISRIFRYFLSKQV